MNHEIDPREALVLLESGEAIALDVREPYEWQAGRIDGALHIPLGELRQRPSELPKSTPIVAVCRSGSRSSAVVGPLRQLGYEVLNLAGGLASWHRQQLPLAPANGRVA